MTGPEHYAIAEKLALAQTVVHGGQRLMRDHPSQYVISLAQVHATLALAAATALGPCDEFLHDGDHLAWTVAAFDREPS